MYKVLGYKTSFLPTVLYIFEYLYLSVYFYTYLNI